MEPQLPPLHAVGRCGTSLPHVPALSTPLVRVRVPWAPSEHQLGGGGGGSRDPHGATTRTGSDWGCSKVTGGTCSSTGLWEGFPPPAGAARACGLARGFPGGGTPLKLLSHGTPSPCHVPSPDCSSSARGSAAEGPVSVLLSLERGLSLHGLIFSFAAEFLSPNNRTEAAAKLAAGLRVTLRTAAQDPLLRFLDTKEDFSAWPRGRGRAGGASGGPAALHPGTQPFPWVGRFRSWGRSGEGWVRLWDVVAWGGLWLRCPPVSVLWGSCGVGATQPSLARGGSAARLPPRPGWWGGRRYSQKANLPASKGQDFHGASLENYVYLGLMMSANGGMQSELLSVCGWLPGQKGQVQQIPSQMVFLATLG